MPDLADGQTYEMQGSGKNPYRLKNVGGVYSCTCPAWCNQNLPSNARTCKHIRKLRGDAAEEARLASAGELKPLKPVGAEDKKELPLLKGEPWDWAQDLTGWWLSEKLDGVRAYWDGKQFLSRGYNIYDAPDWFKAGLPNHPLDGELWIGRKKFQDASDIARSQNQPDRWKPMKYLIFDAPDAKGPFEDRMKFLADALPTWKSQFTVSVEQLVCKGNDHLEEELERILALGGEGLMVRKPGSHYERTRSSTILKVKKFLDMEVIVDDYEAGEGRHKGRVGALWVKLNTGVKCKVGTGLKDKDRDNPPAKGSIITVKYQELTPDGALRFPVYVGPRPDGFPNAAPPTRKKATAPVVEVASAPVAVAVAAPAPKAAAVAEAAASPKTAKATKPVSVSVPTPTPVPSGGSTMAATPKRYFEFIDGDSKKFWEIWMDGKDVTTNWGKIGTAGQTKTKPFPDEAKAKKEYDKLLAEKTGKGYSEKPRPA
ncbi:MAG: DNA ligase [Planctomycetes bacterium]|nr:DNA ligase [Planctomycetota bacterium]